MEHESFTELVDLLRPKVSIPKRAKLKALITQHVNYIEENILRDIDSTTKYSLALDVWSSPFRQSFLGVTIYFIDKNWEFKEELLAFKPLLQKHTGWEMANIVYSLLKKYKITSRLLVVTADNAASNNKLRQFLSTLLKEKEGIDWNYKQGTIRCLAHVIQLSLGAVFSSLKVSEAEELDFTSITQATLPTISSHVSWANTINKVCYLFFIYLFHILYNYNNKFTYIHHFFFIVFITSFITTMFTV